VRLPFPDRIPIVPVFFFAVTLCVVQQVQGTNSTFSLLCFFYILLAAVAFNVAGGFTQTSGAYIFFNTVLSLILGLCMKVYLGEAADSNLSAPILTMKLYVAGIAMMLVAVFLSKKVTTKRSILGKMITDAKLQTATVGCLIAGILIFVAGLVVPAGNGSVLSALNQVNRFFPLAAVLGVINAIRRSGGTRSISLPVIIATSLMFAVGAVGFSKEGMFVPFACWILAAASQSYKLSRTQIFVMLLGTIFVFRYLVPYAQYGRTLRDENGVGNVSTSISLLLNLGYVREQYVETSADQYEDRVLGYYNNPQGFFDRLQMISIDDALINETEQSGTFGFYPIIWSFENLVPHFIWKDKPAIGLGNMWAHEVGLLSPDDESTGVSFSSISSAFHLIGWPGIFFLAPVLWFFLFFIFDSLCGDIRKSPWGLLVLVLYAHAGPEADIATLIYMYFYTSFGIVFAAIVGAYVMPVVGTLFIGPEGIGLRRGRPIRSIAGRLLPPARTSES
jgi:hypothetical protein